MCPLAPETGHPDGGPFKRCTKCGREWTRRDQMITDPEVRLVGYQANGTLGRFLQDGAKSVRIQGDEIKVAARIRMIDEYSGHADGAWHPWPEFWSGGG